jgi:hypothetical protein
MATNGKRNRQAGHAYERQIIKELKKLGFPEAVSARSESRNLDDQGVDICNTPGFHFQCKNSKTNPNYVELLQTMPDNLYGRKDLPHIPVIVHKKTKKSEKNFTPVGEFVMLKKSDFYRMLSMFIMR